MMHTIPLMKPFITDEIKEKVLAVLDSGYLTEGPVTKEFETAFTTYIGCKEAIAISSCTTGLEVALRALGIGPGDEVIVPDYTYPATAAVVAIVGATCVIVDIDKQSMLIDIAAIKNAITPKTKAIIPVSLFGNPLDYEALNAIKKEHNLFLIEDAACTIGAEYNNTRVGTQADISVFSLHPRKFITTGEGGMITTNNPVWAEWMRSYKRFGISNRDSNREQMMFDIIGTNYKLSNLASAIGVVQMKSIDTLLSKRRALAKQYDTLFTNNSRVMLPTVTKNAIHSYQSYCIFVPERDRIMQTLRAEGIEVQIGTYSLHMHNAFNNHPLIRIEGTMTQSLSAYHECLTLPLYHDMTITEQQTVVDAITRLL